MYPTYPPPGTTAVPNLNPDSMRRLYYVSTPQSGGGNNLTGPFRATRTPDSQGLQVAKEGELVTISDRISIERGSNVRVRCILTDVQTGESFEVLQARVYQTRIECLVSSTQAFT